MNKIKISVAVLALLAACAYKLPEALVLKIFERHSFKEHDPEKLKTFIRRGGLAGLDLEDKYAGVVREKPQVKVSLEKPGPSAGMLAGLKGGNYYLLKVFKGSPAEAAGLKDGDKLLSLNSSAPGTEGFLKALSGKEDYTVKAARRSKEGVSELTAEIKRGEFYLPNTFGLYEPETRVAIVRIGLFLNDTASIAAAGLAGLEKAGAKGVIFDLRGNKGGSPDEAAALLKLFAAKPGPVLAITSRHKGYTQAFEAAARGRFAGMRAAVLVDQETSMAGEVFAASLKEIAGAAIVGAKTAGNVSIQKTFNLGDGRGFRLTVARLVPSSGADLEGVGLVPDAPVESPGKAWPAIQPDALLKDPVYLRALEIIGNKPEASHGRR